MSFVTTFGLLLLAGLIALRFLGRDFITRSRTGLTQRMQERLSAPGAQPNDGAPYRDAREARILALESENRALKEELREQELTLESVHQHATEPTESPAVPALFWKRLFCLIVLAEVGGFVLGNAPDVRRCTDCEPSLQSYAPFPPTMLDSSMRTSGGEAPYESYVIVIDVLRFEPWPYWCQEYDLFLLAWYDVIERTEDGYAFLTRYLVIYADDPLGPRLIL